MSRVIQWLGALACGGAVLGAAGLARAEPAEYQLVLLDRTGSMSTTDAVDIGGSTISRWARAATLAKGWVDEDKKTYATTARAYAIYTFSTADADGVMQRQWPKVATDCTSLGLTVANDLNGSLAWCELRKVQADYDKVKAQITSIAANLSPDGSTPLADALCGAIEKAYNGTQNKQRVVVLESDGEENSSLIQTCGGNQSDSGYTAWDKTKPDWGMTDSTINYSASGLTQGAWEALVVRKLTRFETVGNLWKPGYLSNVDVAPPSFSWRVDFHYRWCVADPNVPCSAFATAFMPLALGPVRLDATPAPVPLPQVAKDYNFMKALGTSNPKSKFRPIVTITGSQFGLNHAVPGDVDDGGCTDQADLNIMRQADVWHQVAAAPRQIAIRADLDRNGYVDEADRAILLSFWATGCINPVANPVY